MNRSGRSPRRSTERSGRYRCLHRGAPRPGARAGLRRSTLSPDFPTSRLPLNLSKASSLATHLDRSGAGGQWGRRRSKPSASRIRIVSTLLPGCMARNADNEWIAAISASAFAPLPHCPTAPLRCVLHDKMEGGKEALKFSGRDRSLSSAFQSSRLPVNLSKPSDYSRHQSRRVP
jgi:hypothetical protein